MFLLAGEDIAERLRYHHLFSQDRYLYRFNVLRLDHRHQQEPLLSAALHFPAQRITTAYTWDDLVLARPTREEIEDIVTWARGTSPTLSFVLETSPLGGPTGAPRVDGLRVTADATSVFSV